MRLFGEIGLVRSAAHYYLSHLMLGEKPEGKIADIGAGESLIQDYVDEGLVVVDASSKMLERNRDVLQKRKVDILREPFGDEEFDWVFSILGDPYNSEAAWRNIARAMKCGGRCLFCVPSWTWTAKFREKVISERQGCARFELSDGSVVFLRSVVLPQAEQKSLIEAAGLVVESLDWVRVCDLKEVHSRKIADFLTANDPILDVYKIVKPGRI